MAYYPIDAMQPGESVVLLVTATNPDSHKWAKRTPVTVDKIATGWRYSSEHGTTHAESESGKVNPGHQGMNHHMKTLTGVPWPVDSSLESELIRRAYRAERQRLAMGRYSHGAGVASEALRRARAMVANGTDSGYARDSVWAGLGGSDGATFEAYGESRCRWFENPESKGLRFIGLAHDVGKAGYSHMRDAVEHTGHYLDPDGHGETICGVVYALPGRNGRAQYLFGYADPHNTDSDGRGPACLSLEILEGDARDSDYDPDSALRDAARRGDSMAESYADSEREYQESYREGAKARTLASDARETCKAWAESYRAARTIFAERRTMNPNAARQVFAALAKGTRESCDAFTTARDAARAARDAAPGLAWGGKSTPRRLKAGKMAIVRGNHNGPPVVSRDL